MNNDLISRSELKKALEEDMKCGGVKINEFDKGYDLGIKTAIEMLDNAPTVEAVAVEHHNRIKDILQNEVDSLVEIYDSERPQGEWIYNQYDANPKIGNWHCSICHTICYEMKLAHDNFNYCPNCGAKMKGGEE